MSESKTGGPAFPLACQGPTTAPEIYYGMNLRDYFAAKAMQGVLASGEADRILKESDMDWPSAIAIDAYAMADAMLKARGQA